MVPYFTEALIMLTVDFNNIVHCVRIFKTTFIRGNAPYRHIVNIQRDSTVIGHVHEKSPTESLMHGMMLNVSGNGMEVHCVYEERTRFVQLLMKV